MYKRQPKPGAEFVARMEDVLDVYQRPYDPLRPVVDVYKRQLLPPMDFFEYTKAI